MQRREPPGSPPKDEARAYSQPVTPEESRDSLFDELSPDNPGDWALSLSVPADPGHRDELRAGGKSSGDALAPAWDSFFEHIGTDGLADLSRRNDNLQRQIRDNGVTYNVYADSAKGLQRRPLARGLERARHLLQPRHQRARGLQAFEHGLQPARHQRSDRCHARGRPPARPSPRVPLPARVRASPGGVRSASRYPRVDGANPEYPSGGRPR